MRTFFLTTALLCLGAILGNSQLSALSDTLETKTVLYKLTHPESEYTSYLFGTHHAFGKPFFDALQNANEALLSSNIFIKENLNLPGQLAEDYINQRNEKIKWSKYLSQEEYEYVKSIFASSKLEFDKMKPAELFVFLNRFYNERICLEKDPSADYFSLDDHIGSIAKTNQLEVYGLETTADQLEYINQDVEGMPKKVHKKRLSRMINRIKEKSTADCNEIGWYETMDFDFKLHQTCTNTLMLGERNNKWIPQLKEHFRTQNCFVAVGLSHLMFECGLIRQLQNSGYEITPIQVK